jgi:hypothetical protein
MTVRYIPLTDMLVSESTTDDHYHHSHDKQHLTDPELHLQRGVLFEVHWVPTVVVRLHFFLLKVLGS